MQPVTFNEPGTYLLTVDLSFRDTQDIGAAPAAVVRTDVFRTFPLPMAVFPNAIWALQFDANPLADPRLVVQRQSGSALILVPQAGTDIQVRVSRDGAPFNTIAIGGPPGPQGPQGTQGVPASLTLVKISSLCLPCGP